MDYIKEKRTTKFITSLSLRFATEIEHFSSHRSAPTGSKTITNPNLTDSEPVSLTPVQRPYPSSAAFPKLSGGYSNATPSNKSG